MFKKMISFFISVLLLVFLGGCRKNPLLEVRVIEDYQVLGLEIPKFPRIDWNFGGNGFSIEVLNGSTGDVEQFIESNDYKQFGSLQVSGNYYILEIWQMDEEYLSFISEFLIFDKDFNLVESFRIDQNSIAYSKGRGFHPQLALDEAGNWLIYLWESTSDFAGPSQIYTYNFNNHELILVTEVEALISLLHLVPSTNQLALTVIPGFDRVVEFHFLDLDTLEEEIVFQVENLGLSQVTVSGEFLLVETISDNEERETILIHSQTEEVNIIPSGYEGSLHGSPGATLDGELLFLFQHEFRGWELSDIVSWVRLYDTSNTELVFEYQLINEDTLAIGEGVLDIEFVNIDVDIYLIRAVIIKEEMTGLGLKIIDTRF